jgi:hypothetical protein
MHACGSCVYECVLNYYLCISYDADGGGGGGDYDNDDNYRDEELNIQKVMIFEVL